jgi:hypothetical protein
VFRGLPSEVVNNKPIKNIAAQLGQAFQGQDNVFHRFVPVLFSVLYYTGKCQKSFVKCFNFQKSRLARFAW